MGHTTRVAASVLFTLFAAMLISMLWNGATGKSWEPDGDGFLAFIIGATLWRVVSLEQAHTGDQGR